jgi:hypothetical protein
MLDESGGTSAGDTSGNANNGTLANGPAWIAGQVGGALRFDGTNDSVNTADAPSLNPATSALTLAAWVYPENVTAGGMVISKGASAVQYQLRLLAGKVRFGVKAGGTGTYQEAPFTFANNAWYHVSGAYDGANMRIYVDGTMIGVAAKSGALAATDGVGISLGKRSGATNSCFKGRIDDARIYSRALSTSEISALAILGP